LGLAFSKDGDTLVAVRGTGGQAEMFDLKNSRDVLMDEGHTGAIQALDVSPNGRTILTGSTDATFRLWDVKTGKGRVFCTGYANGASTACFSPTGRTLATSTTGKIILWDVASGKELRRFLAADTASWHRVGFAPDGKSLAIVSGGLEYRFVDVETGQELRSFTWGIGNGLPPDGSLWLTHLPFRLSPDGKYFASLYTKSFKEYRVALWDLSKPEPKVLEPASERIVDIAFSVDAEYVAWSDRQHVHVWDVRADRMLKTLKHDPPSNCLAFTPDGRYLVSGKKLHPLSSKYPPLELPVQPGCLAFSSDGSVLAVVPQNDLGPHFWLNDRRLAVNECTVLLFDLKKLVQK
jgi:WD40 repeat protein